MKAKKWYYLVTQTNEQKSKNYFSDTVVIAAKPCLVLSIYKVIQAGDSIDQ